MCPISYKDLSFGKTKFFVRKNIRFHYFRLTFSKCFSLSNAYVLEENFYFLLDYKIFNEIWRPEPCMLQKQVIHTYHISNELFKKRLLKQWQLSETFLNFHIYLFFLYSENFMVMWCVRLLLWFHNEHHP